MQFTRIIVLYFVLGALMFGGGAVTWDNSGPTQHFINMGPDTVSPNDDIQDELEGVGSSITNLIGSFGGPVLLVWNLFFGLVSFIHWPLFVFSDAGAPVEITVLLGGTLTAMFYMAVIRLVTQSA